MHGTGLLPHNAMMSLNPQRPLDGMYSGNQEESFIENESFLKETRFPREYFLATLCLDS
jgi:hypothetical protein